MIAIVGHVARAEMINQLADTIHADYVTIDDGTLGCEGNHRKAWNHLAGCPGPWQVVLEDDAAPVDGFRDQLGRALAAAPAPIVGLYLGTSYPEHWQARIDQALGAAGDANWLLGTTLIHAVGVAIRTDLLPLRLQTGMTIEHAISNWAKTAGHQVAHSLPSLVDHYDGPAVIRNRYGDNRKRTLPRRARRVGTRPHWNSTIAPL